jgi:hypothetical protein
VAGATGGLPGRPDFSQLEINRCWPTPCSTAPHGE